MGARFATITKKGVRVPISRVPTLHECEAGRAWAVRLARQQMASRSGERDIDIIAEG